LHQISKHHQLIAVERFTLPRKEGERGCIDILNAYHKQIENLRQYFKSQQDSNLHKAIIAIENSFTLLKLSDDQFTPLSTIHSDIEKTESWKNKIIHRKHPYQLSLEYVDKEASNMWLCKGQLYAEMEDFAIAIQDQVINTKNYLKHVIKDSNVVDDKCRRCKNQQETIEHITSRCSLLAPNEYTQA
jgi:hypothetical protein